MSTYIYLLTTRFLRLILRVFHLGKIQKNQIVFTSYLGKQYSCNPKYISEYLRIHAPEYRIIWAFRDPEKYRFLEKAGIEIVRYNSLSFIQKCLTSRYIITNVRDMTHIPFRKQQTVINTWHGGGAYKCVGTSNALQTKEEDFRQKTARKSPLVYLSSSRIFTDLTIRQSFHHTGDIIEAGMPRNDILVKQNRPDLRRKVYDYYQLPDDTRILIYAPTFREAKKAEDYAFDGERIRRALAERFGGSWVIFFRLHYYIAEHLATGNQSYLNVSDYPDMQELLYAADILVTDYSSSMWDFALTRKPCFLYATDLSAYDLKRGFYTDIHTWPFPLSESSDALVSSILHFDDERYRRDVAHHLQDFGNYETGAACSAVLDYLRCHPKQDQ